MEWWEANKNLRAKFEAKSKELGRNHQLSEVIISGFSLSTYQTISNHFTYLKYTNQEFTTVEEILGILRLPQEF